MKSMYFFYAYQLLPLPYTESTPENCQSARWLFPRDVYLFILNQGFFELFEEKAIHEERVYRKEDCAGSWGSQFAPATSSGTCLKYRNLASFCQWHGSLLYLFSVASFCHIRLKLQSELVMDKQLCVGVSCECNGKSVFLQMSVDYKVVTRHAVIIWQWSRPPYALSLGDSPVLSHLATAAAQLG